MSLVQSSLEQGLHEAMETAFNASKNIGADYDEDDQDIVMKELVKKSALALESYLEAMIDPTGDPPKDIPLSTLKDIFWIIYDYDHIEKQSFSIASDAQPRVQAKWASLFTMAFKTNIPPPDGSKEVSAEAASPTVVGPLLNAYSSSTRAQFITNLATAFHAGASTITVTINYIGSADGSPKTLTGVVS